MIRDYNFNTPYVIYHMIFIQNKCSGLCIRCLGISISLWYARIERKDNLPSPRVTREINNSMMNKTRHGIKGNEKTSLSNWERVEREWAARWIILERKGRVNLHVLLCECGWTASIVARGTLTRCISLTGVAKYLVTFEIIKYGYLGIQLGGVRSTSQVAKSFMGTGRVAWVVFIRSAILLALWGLDTHSHQTPWTIRGARLTDFFTFLDSYYNLLAAAVLKTQAAAINLLVLSPALRINVVESSDWQSHLWIVSVTIIDRYISNRSFKYNWGLSCIKYM